MPVNCGTCPANSGKVVVLHPEFFGKKLNLFVKIGVGHTGTGLIQVHRWGQTPNNNLAGRIWLTDLPAEGGYFTFTPLPESKWLSFFQNNPTKSGLEGRKWDCCCVTINNIFSEITLVYF